MLYGPLPVSSLGGNLAGGRVDQEIDWLLKRRVHAGDDGPPLAERRHVA